MKNCAQLLGITTLAATLALAACGGGGGGGGHHGGGDDGGDNAGVVTVNGVSLNKEGTSLVIGATEQLTATVTPENATNATISWVSSDGSVAAVSSSGLVTAVAAGKAAVTVTTEDGSFTDTCTVTVSDTGPKKDNKTTYSGDGVSFKMAPVPGGTTFPSDWDDSKTATVAGAYWIGETEVTYELWQKVYAWATTDAGGGKRADGGDLYHFQNAGAMGDGTGDTNQHPVTTVSWRDCMVWCNALTEWYNAVNGTGYACVYTLDGGYGAPIRNSSDGSNGSSADLTEGSFDNPYINPGARGFRLPSSDEWELAARWRSDATNAVSGYSDPYFTKGDSASGATAPYSNADADDLVAWYFDNSDLSMHQVKGKEANGLGLYDMSGNAMEWCFDWHPDFVDAHRVVRGGSFLHDPEQMPLSLLWHYDPFAEDSITGFRLARAQ